MQKKYDAVIVGGGPVGGNIARKIASENYNVAVFEQNKQIGEPLKCAGLVTPRIFDFVDFSKESVVQNKIKGANIHSPSNHKLSIGGDKVHALVIDRINFDKKIIEKSKKKGADVYLGNKIISAQKHQHNIELKSSQKNDVKCDLLIGADGPYSKIRDIFALPQPTEFLIGIGAEFTGVKLDSDFVEIFVGNEIAPGFFAWIIPTNKQGTNARIGLCIKQNSHFPPKHYFESFLKNKSTSEFFNEIKISKYIAGAVPLGALKKTTFSHLMIVGDAAAQVKPTSGGGIYTGLLCGEYCSNVAIEALQKKNFTNQFLRKYHKQWSTSIGSELSMGMKFRKIFRNLPDQQMDKYITKFQNPKILQIITKNGDIDYPSRLAKPLLKKVPSLLKFIPKIIKK